MELRVQKRQAGKAKKLIKKGFVPGVVYGKSLKTPILVKMKRSDFIKLYKQAGTSTPVVLKGDDFEQMVLIHDYQLDPVKDTVIHVDFLAIRQDEKVKAAVPIVVEGIEELNKKGLEINMVTDEIEVEAIPSKLPKEIKINVASLEDGDNISVGDLRLDEEVEILSDKGEILVTVYNPAEQSEEEELETQASEEASETTQEEKNE